MTGNDKKPAKKLKEKLTIDVTKSKVRKPSKNDKGKSKKKGK